MGNRLLGEHREIGIARTQERVRLIDVLAVGRGGPDEERRRHAAQDEDRQEEEGWSCGEMPHAATSLGAGWERA